MKDLQRSTLVKGCGYYSYVIVMSNLQLLEIPKAF